MRQSKPKGKPQGKSSFNPADSIAKDSAARLALGMNGPNVPKRGGPIALRSVKRK